MVSWTVFYLGCHLIPATIAATIRKYFGGSLEQVADAFLETFILMLPVVPMVIIMVLFSGGG